MATPSVAASVFKLVMAGEQAGFTIEQMMELLKAGMPVATLLRLIERRLTPAQIETCQLQSSRW